MTGSENHTCKWGYGHALGARTSGRAVGGHEGDRRGQWKRPFELPILFGVLILLDGKGMTVAPVIRTVARRDDAKWLVFVGVSFSITPVRRDARHHGADRNHAP
jgi:hypothetical protein